MSLPDHNASHIARATEKRAREMESEKLYQQNLRKRSKPVFFLVFLIFALFSIDTYYLEEVSTEETVSISNLSSERNELYKIATPDFTFFSTSTPLTGNNKYRITHSKILRVVKHFARGENSEQLYPAKSFYDYALFLPITAILAFLTAAGSKIPDKYWNFFWFFSIVFTLISALSYIAMR